MGTTFVCVSHATAYFVFKISSFLKYRMNPNLWFMNVIPSMTIEWRLESVRVSKSDSDWPTSML